MRSSAGFTVERSPKCGSWVWFGVIGTCGFGVMMAIQGMVWDAWKWVMGPNTWVEDEPFAGADDEKKCAAPAAPSWTEKAAAYQLIPPTIANLAAHPHRSAAFLNPFLNVARGLDDTLGDRAP